MSTLGAVLQGMDRGVMNGLNLYKTVQDEARQKRRDTLEDARYKEEREYRNTRDEVMDARDDRNHTWEKDKYDIEQKRLAAAAEATANYRQQQLNFRVAEYGLKASKENRAISKERKAEWDGRVKTGVEAFSAAFKDNPEAAQDMYAGNVYARIGVNQKVAQAQGFELDAKTASRLYAMPRPDGTYVIGQHTEKGFEPYDADPESDGQQALVMPSDVFARTFAGTEGAQSLQARDARVGARQQVVSAANNQYGADNAYILARGEEAKQAASRAEDELATLSKLPVYVTSTNYRGDKTTRFNPQLRELGINTPQQFEEKKRSLAGVLSQSQGQLGSMLANQDRARTSAAEALSNNLGYLDQATAGAKNADVPVALTNTLGQISAGNGQRIRPGEAPDAALKLNMEESKALYSTVGGIVNGAIPKGKDAEFRNSSPTKITSSLVAAAEKNGELRQWAATPMGIAGLGQIAAEMARRDMDYGGGFLMKVMAMQRKGAQIEAGLDALQNKVVQSLPAQDREPIALLASEIIGRDTDDPEAAIAMAIKAYNGGQKPQSLADMGR